MKRGNLAMLNALSQVDVQQDYIAMIGGMDQVTAPLQRRPGTVRLAQNYEAMQLGGYRRMKGYERYDGRVRPSAATYAILQATITGSPAVGDTLTGAGGATGKIIALPGGSFILTKVTGTFVNGEDLDVGGPTIATAIGTQVVGGAATPKLHAQYKNLAADVYRADIAAVPGSGNVLGVWLFDDVRYAFRNNAGGTAAEMYKSTTGGWSKVNFEYEIAYTVGSGSVDDGDTLTQGAVTATVRRVLVRTGTLGGGTAAGTLVISAPAGGNFAAGAATTTGGGTLTLSAAETAITLAPSGRFEFVNHNFGGAANTKRMYGVDGKNPAFEFDGTYFVPIHTGMTTDTPTHIAAHRKHLFLAFGGSAQHSSIGAPYGWSPITGAAELAVGDSIAGFKQLPGSEANAALAIFSRNQLKILYGSSSADWNLVEYREELGAYEHTIQDVGYTMFLDDRGITNMQAAQEYGNFAHNAISDQIKDFVNTYRSSAVASCISRDSSQYRLFFTNKYALYVTVVGRKVVGIMQMLFADTVRCICSAEANDGSEVIFFGSDDGWVYEMERGTSFDGDAIEYYIELAFNFSKRPRVNKRYRDAMIEVSGNGYAEFNVGYSLGYSTPQLAQPGLQSIVTNFSATRWDAFTWDAFFWDGLTLMPTTIRMEGEAENYSLAFRGNSDYFEAFTITGALVQFTPRRRLR